MTNQPPLGRAAVAPSLAPLPDMQCCAWCHRLAVDYQRAGGSFVCSECWADHVDKCPVEHTQEQEQEPAGGKALHDAVATLTAHGLRWLQREGDRS